MSRAAFCHLLSLASAVAACVGALGCSNDYRVDFRFVTDAPSSVDVNSDGIAVPAGIAVGVDAFPVEDDERRSYSLELIPKRPDIIGVDKGLEENRYVIYGIKDGSTEVEMHFDGEYVGDLPARVFEEHAPAD